MTAAGALALGVLVPCRNEAAVIERKLRNFSRCAWPPLPAGRAHELLVVDDGSDDDTAALGRSLCAALFPAGGPVRARVVDNAVRPGKTGAIQAGLDALGPDAELIVLSDADVVLRTGSLVALAEAFAARAALGMACGRQEFVRDLHPDGSCRGADGGDPRPAPEPYDRFAARVRRLETLSGRLFSVHGQLLAWRRSLELRPTPGLAADDLDLMFQARAAGVRIELLQGAPFLEVKTRQPQAKAEQDLRRARAFVQVMEGRRAPPGAPLADRLQLWLYRRGPLAAPLLVSAWIVPVHAVIASLLLLAAYHADTTAGVVVALGLLVTQLALPVLALATRRGREIVHLLQVIRAAERLQRESVLQDRWEMTRH